MISPSRIFHAINGNALCGRLVEGGFTVQMIACNLPSLPHVYLDGTIPDTDFVMASMRDRRSRDHGYPAKPPSAKRLQSRSPAPVGNLGGATEIRGRIRNLRVFAIYKHLLRGSNDFLAFNKFSSRFAGFPCQNQDDKYFPAMVHFLSGTLGADV